jgi:hypothetical protein
MDCLRQCEEGSSRRQGRMSLLFIMRTANYAMPTCSLWCTTQCKWMPFELRDGGNVNENVVSGLIREARRARDDQVCDLDMTRISYSRWFDVSPIITTSV